MFPSDRSKIAELAPLTEIPELMVKSEPWIIAEPAEVVIAPATVIATLLPVLPNRKLPVFRETAEEPQV